MEGGRTRLYEVSGTLRYMAPEQLTARGATRATDLYALGAVIHELLFGYTPHGDAEVWEVCPPALTTPGAIAGPFLLRRATEPVAIPQDQNIPGGVRLLISSLLMPDPLARPQIRPRSDNRNVQRHRGLATAVEYC
jgi:serine/threonine protein kinase